MILFLYFIILDTLYHEAFVLLWVEWIIPLGYFIFSKDTANLIASWYDTSEVSPRISLMGKHPHKWKSHKLKVAN